MSKQYSVRELQNILEENGYLRKRIHGSHAIYKKGANVIALPIVTLNYKVGNKIVNQIAKGVN